MYKGDRRWTVVSIVLLKMGTIFVYVIPVVYVHLMHHFQRIYFSWKLIHYLNYVTFLPNSQLKEVCNTKFHRYMNSADIHERVIYNKASNLSSYNHSQYD